MLVKNLPNNVNEDELPANDYYSILKLRLYKIKYNKSDNKSDNKKDKYSFIDPLRKCIYKLENNNQCMRVNKTNGARCKRNKYTGDYCHQHDK